MDVPKALLLISLVITVVGCLTWRRGGKGVALSGLTLATMAIYMLLPDSESAIRIALLTIFAVLVLTAVAGSRRADWRRPETLLLGAMAVTVLASYFLQDVVASAGHKALLVLFGLFWVSFMTVTFLGLVRDLRSSQPSER